MKTKIDKTSFGSITISGNTYDHDVVIDQNGEISKRKKKLSKAIYGTSHTLSLDEAKYIYQPGAEELIIGTGQTGYLELSDEAADFFRQNNCRVQMLSTPEALKAWNNASGNTIGLFHVTC
ncbi:MAG: MTH938/NDUFAF3 family protein [Marinilabilia sp.]